MLFTEHVTPENRDMSYLSSTTVYAIDISPEKASEIAYIKEFIHPRTRARAIKDTIVPLGLDYDY